MEAHPEPTIEQALAELAVTVDEGTPPYMQLFSLAITSKSRTMTTRHSVI